MITVGGEYVVTATLGRAGWRKSTYSSNGVDCVDVDFTSEGAEIRHSRHPDGSVIKFAVGEWTAWLEEVARHELSNTNGAVAVDIEHDGSWRVRSTRVSAELTFTHSEVVAFRLGVLAGEFNREAELARVS